jgi:fibronectin-binding autotransporter adhesin
MKLFSGAGIVLLLVCAPGLAQDTHPGGIAINFNHKAAHYLFAPTISGDSVMGVWANPSIGPGSWTSSSNWVTGTAHGLDYVAAFTSAFRSPDEQPNVGGAVSNAGLYFKGTATLGWDIVRNGTNTLTLTANGTTLSSASNFAPVADADISWTGATSTTWNTNTNWSTLTVPAASDNAVFNGTFTLGRQPNLTANATVGGLWMTSGVGQSVTISATGARTLTLAGSTINGVASRGILVDNSNAFTLTITAPLQVGSSQTWINNSGNLLIVSGAVALSSNNNTRTLTVDGSGNTAITGIMSNGPQGNSVGALTKAGTGTLTLSGVNTYTGTTTVNAGTLRATTSASALGAGALTLAGGTLALANNTGLNFGRNTTISANSTIISDRVTSGAGVIHTLGTLSIGANTLSVAAGGNVNSNSPYGLTFGSTTFTGDATFSVANNGTGTGTLTLGALNGGAVARTITKSGTGALTLGSAATSLVDGTAINITAGTLNSNNATALGSLANVTVSSGATLSLGASQTLGALNGSAGSVTLGASTLTVGSTNDLNSSFGGVISGTGALTKAGTGTLTLSGANTYAGLTTVSAGILNIQNGSALGATTTGTTVSSGATLQLQGGISVSAEALTISGAGAAGQNGALVNVSGINNYGGLLSLGAASTISSNSGTLNLTNSGTITGAGLNLTLAASGIGSIASVIGTGTGTVTKNGSGQWILTGNNTYTGGTIISAGTLQLGNGGTSGSIVGDVVNKGTFAVNRSDTFTFGGVISGAGTLQQIGAGTTVLTGTNTYTGGTTISAGALQLGNGGTSGSIVGDVVNNGIFAVNRSDTFTFGGVISGAGAFQQLGTGTTVLTGTNTYTGTTTVNGGSLLVDGSIASASTSVNSGALLGGNGTIAGSVAIADGGILAPGHGAGTLTVGSLTLGNASLLNYQLGIPGVVGMGINDLTNVTGNLTLDGILNTAALPGFGPGAYRLFNYGGVLTNNVLDIGAVPAGFNASDFLIVTGVPNQVNLLVLGGPVSITQFWDGPNTVANGAIDGGSGNWDNFITNWTNSTGTANSSWQNGTAVFGGSAGTVTLTDQIFFAGMVFMTDGYLINAAGANSLHLVGSPTITVADSVTATINAPINGASGITKDGSGTLVLTGASSYTGGTTISTGTLQLGNGGTTGSIVGDVVDNGIFAINRSDTYTFGGVISGTGAFAQIGPGTTILTATNTYSGDTNINAGTLQVDGLIASANTFVNHGGALAGIGTIGGNLFNSAVVSPGDSPGTLTVNGNYTQNATGTLRIEIGGLALPRHDLLQMSGNATLNGTLQLVRLNSFAPLGGDRVIVLSATGGVTGTFATVEWGGTLLSVEVIYDPTDVRVVFEQGSFVLPGLTPNEQAVAENLDRSVGDSRAADLIGFLDTEPLANLPHDYDLIAPEELASIYEIGFSQATIQWQNIQRRTDDIRAGSTGFSAAGYQMHDTHGFAKGADGKMVLEKGSVMEPSPENRWGVFITGTTQFVNVGDQDLNAPGYDITTGGVTVGVDYRLSNNFAIGLSGTYAHSNADLVNDGRVEVGGGKSGLYASYFSDGFYVDLAANGGWNSYDARRTALLGQARGSSDGAEFNGLIGAGYDWKIGALRFGPIATFQYSYIGLDSFTERGSLAPLRYPDQNEDSVRSTLGGRFSHDVKLGGMTFRPEVRVAWQHEYNDRAYPIDAQFASGAGALFTVHGPRIGRDSALLGAGVALSWNERVSTYLYYDGQFGRSNYDSNNVSGGVRVSF